MTPPIVTATLQATTLASISNIIAQLLDEYRKNLPLSLDIPQFLRFLFVSVISAPPNFLWQGWLERTFPGRFPTSARDESLEFAERGHSGLLEKPEYKREDDGRDGDAPREGRLNWRNTMTKWFIDCITVGALFNTVAFLLFMGVLKGKTGGEIWGSVKVETLPIIIAGYKIWPIASIISFSLIPVEKRIVFLSAVGLCWGIYMSLVAART